MVSLTVLDSLHDRKSGFVGDPPTAAQSGQTSASDNQRDRCVCCTADCEQHALNSLKKQQMFWSYSSHCFFLTEITDVGNSLFASENQ